MEYCCHLWGGACSDALGLIDNIQKRVANIIGPILAASLQPLSIRRDVASLSLFYKCYHDHCSVDLFSLVPPSKVFQRVTRLPSHLNPFTVTVPCGDTVSFLTLPCVTLSPCLASELIMTFTLLSLMLIAFCLLILFLLSIIFPLLPTF